MKTYLMVFTETSSNDIPQYMTPPEREQIRRTVPESLSDSLHFIAETKCNTLPSVSTFLRHVIQCDEYNNGGPVYTVSHLVQLDDPGIQYIHP